MTDPKTPQHNPNPTHLPGEVERANDAHRSSEPKPGKRDSTAQETARQVNRKP
ncbi:hypothetical protein [Pseudomonas sp.]|uniref:hypothetical protein n=1 Tax=Pseudomonas sp. TaxID=306 RepID=UPI003CC59032